MKAAAGEPLVVIPTVQGGELLAAALAAVEGWPVLVVDDSPGGLVQELPAEVARLATGGLGFAGACSAGLAAAADRGHELVLLLNDDARPAPGCVAGMLGAWREGVGAIGAVLVDEEEAVQSAGIDLAWWGRVRERRRMPVEDEPVDAVSGACMLVSSGVRFAPGFPHGMEDVELCRRLRAQGLAVLVVAHARCLHLGGATLPRRSPEAARAALAGHLRLVGPGWRQGVALGLAVAQSLREGGGRRRLGALKQAWEQR